MTKANPPEEISFFKKAVLILCTTSLLPFTVNLIVSSNHVILERQQSLENYPKWSDFYVTVAATVIIICARESLTPIFAKWLAPRLLEEKKLRQKERVGRFAAVVFKFCYFLVAVTAGWIVLAPRTWTPPLLGGQGDLQELFTDYPDQKSFPCVQNYILVSLAYHVHSWCYQVFAFHKRNDFWEMVLHHTATVILISGSYMINYHRVASLVIFIHDISDISCYLIKTVVDTGAKIAIGTAYLNLLATWAWTRLYALPFLLKVCIFESFTIDWSKYGPLFARFQGMGTVDYALYGHGHLAFSVMLFMLQGLHIYWYCLFLMMGKKFVCEGKAKDVQDRIDTDSDIDKGKAKTE